MPIYKQTTEITNIDKIWTSISKDIVEVYFGDKNVFSVWAEIENTLPLTVYASGDDLVNYKIYGNTENGESVGELTENLFDPNATDTTNGYRFSAYLPSSGNIVSITSEVPHFAVSEYIGIPNDNFITLVNVGMVEAPRLAICFYNANKEYISGTEYGSNINKTVEIPSGSVYFRFTIVLSAISSIMIVPGSTAPTSYIPYGYKLPMVTHPELKDIGDTVLVDGEEWDIVNYNAERTVATLCKKKVTVSIPMAQKEALFAFPNGLTAGTYHFTMPQTPWYLLPSDSEKSIEFTLINDVPANGQLFVTPRNSSLIGGTISCYANPTSTAVLETTALSEGNGGSSLESPVLLDDPVGNVNNLICAISGSVIYKNCNIRQWLNSTSPAGNVWSPANKFDRPPTWAGTLDGFMYGMDTDFVDAVAATTFTTASGQNKSYQLTDKFVVPSYTEISGLANYGVLEGEQYQYYTGASADRRKKINAYNVSKSWWLRSIGSYSFANLRFITEKGNYDYNNSSSTIAYIAPTCQIDLTKVSNPWLQNNMYKSRATITPVYIGENQLDAGEYVSYSDGKIYRMVNGTLTPTDPPVPIPALPTIDGETIIDYNPSETPAVEPEKMYVKYRKQGT